MLSDGEFVTNAAAVRGMGIMAGANPQDEYEQRLLGARQMYDYQRKLVILLLLHTWRITLEDY